MARITFIYPDFESLGVEYLMSKCSEAGHAVNFVYYETEDSYLGIKSKHISYENIADKICLTNPDIAAFSCVTDNYQYQLQCANSLKRKDKDIFTIFGGIHPTAVPIKSLQNDCVDAVAIGEAECSLVDFLAECMGKTPFSFPNHPIPGIIFKKNGQIIGKPIEGRLANLDQLPFPDKSPFFSSLRDSLHEYRIITSRGCPYKCSYCFNSFIHQLHGEKTIRRRSVSNVIEELLWAKTKSPLKYVMFVDDSFTANKQWVREFCSRYKTEINLPFACVTNPQYIDEEIAGVLSSAGCINVQMGIQSLSDTLCREVLKRKNDKTKITAAIRSLKNNNIMVQVDHMLGIPGDTIENQEESAIFYNIHRPNLISIFWLTYYPKTAILNFALQEGIIKQGDIELIEQGKRLNNESYLTGGSMKNPYPYYSISFLLNWLPILPQWLVGMLIKSRSYRFFRIKNFYFSTALPRAIQSILNKNDFRGRSHIIRFVDKAVMKSRIVKYLIGQRKN